MEYAIGVNQWAMPMVSVREAAKLAACAGFDCIELNLDESGEVSLETTPEQARQLRGLVEVEGIKVSGVSSSLYWRYSFTSTEANVRARAMAICEKQLELAAEFGAYSILIAPAGLNVQDGELPPRYDQAYRFALEFMSQVSSVAERAQVQIGLETVWNKFLLSPLEMRQFVDDVGSEFVGVYLDVANVLQSGFPEQWIQILGSRIKGVHLKDYLTNVGTLDGFKVGIGEGDVNWSEVGNALRGMGYETPLIAEVFPTLEDQLDLSDYVDRVARQVRSVVDRMRE